MKIKFIIIIIILLLFIVILGTYLYSQKAQEENNLTVEKECNGDNSSNCDISCNTVQDCSPAMDCGCYNQKDADKLAYGKSGNYLLYNVCGPKIGSNCFCTNNKCIREVLE